MFFNSLNAELNPIYKYQLAGLLCGVLKFCACFLKNLNISRTKRDKFVKQRAFCGEGNSHCSECLKNAVMSLLHNREAKFLIKICKYPCDRSFNCLHGGRMIKCFISCFLCCNMQNNFGPHKALCHTWHILTSLRITPLAEHTWHCLFMGFRPGQWLLRLVSSLLMLVFDSETADEPVSHAKPHVALRKTVAHLLG